MGLMCWYPYSLHLWRLTVSIHIYIVNFFWSIFLWKSIIVFRMLPFLSYYRNGCGFCVLLFGLLYMLNCLWLNFFKRINMRYKTKQVYQQKGQENTTKTCISYELITKTSSNTGKETFRQYFHISYSHNSRFTWM